METHDLKTESPEEQSASGGTPLASDLENTLQLGTHIIDCAVGVADLARVEVQLAIHSLPRLVMLWLITMPILLLTWCSFSVLIAWCVWELTGVNAVAFLVFFLLQLLLLLTCHLLYRQYCMRMTLPNTVAQIKTFIRMLNYGSSNTSKTEKKSVSGAS